MNENEQKQIDAIVNILDDTEFSLESFELVPVKDDKGEIIGLKFMMESNLYDLDEGRESALKVLEDHFIGEGFTFKDVLEKLVDDENK